MRYILSIILLLQTGLVLAQEETDTTKSVSILPTFVRAGVDASRIVSTLVDENTTQMEFHFDMDVYRLLLTADFGRVALTRNDALSKPRNFNGVTFDESQSFYLHTKGDFYRIGIEYDFLHANPDHAFFAGIKWARSNYSNNLRYSRNYYYWESNNNPYDLNNPDVQATWMEANAGIKLKVWKGLYLGYTLRLKFNQIIEGSTAFESYDIPGFGIDRGESVLGINYHIFYRFQFREKITVKPIPKNTKLNGNEKN